MRGTGKGGRKYGGKKVSLDGFTFDSQAEARYYQQLKLLKKGGVVASFEMQKRFVLHDKFRHPATGKIVRAITYTPDFVIQYTDGSVKVVDVKGYPNDRFPLKAKMFMKRYNMPLVLAKWSAKLGDFIEEMA